MTDYSAQETRHNPPSMRCSYDNAYGPIYEPSYDYSFIFYDEEEIEEEEESFFNEDDFLFHKLH